MKIGVFLRVLAFLVFLTMSTDSLKLVANADISTALSVSVTIGVGPASATSIDQIIWIGSGWFLDKDIIVTNAHVSAFVPPQLLGSLRFFALLDKSRTPIPLQDRTHFIKGIDLACLFPRQTTSSPSNFPELLTQVPEVGTPIRAIGYPARHLRAAPLELRSTVTSGIVSRTYLERYYGRNPAVREMRDWFQMDVPIRGGNSGGPVVDEIGRVVGVSVAGIEQVIKFWFVTIASIPTHFNFAVEAEHVEYLVEQIKAIPQRTPFHRPDGTIGYKYRARHPWKGKWIDAVSRMSTSSLPIRSIHLTPHGRVGLGNIYTLLGYDDEALKEYSAAAAAGAAIGYLMRGLLKEKLGRSGGKADVEKALRLTKELEPKKNFLKSVGSFFKGTAKKVTSHSDVIKKLLKGIF